MDTFSYIDLGIIDYEECYKLQRELVDRRLAGDIGDTLLLLEHTPVMTIGTSGADGSFLAAPEAFERAGIKVVHTNRGGNVTYHGPGVLVGYPIFDLRSYGKDAHLLLRNLEQAVIDCIGCYGVKGERVSGLTGVWVGGDKICSIGVAVRRWISYHGFAVNVSPIYAHWSMIHPCGLVGREVTALERFTETKPDMSEVKQHMVEAMAKVFDRSAVLGELPK